MIIERIEKDFEYIEESEKLTQLFIIGYSQVNVVVTNAGVVRGGHYHIVVELKEAENNL